MALDPNTDTQLITMSHNAGCCGYTRSRSLMTSFSFLCAAAVLMNFHGATYPARNPTVTLDDIPNDLEEVLILAVCSIAYKSTTRIRWILRCPESFREWSMKW